MLTITVIPAHAGIQAVDQMVCRERFDALDSHPRGNDEKMVQIKRTSDVSHPLDIVSHFFHCSFSVRGIDQFMQLLQELEFCLDIRGPTTSVGGSGIEEQIVE
ncbi:MAG: hypothetical protein EHM79_20900 [Geobacter sp.]|nr:MAG: hypothetical protein EHM79_20900 [Geobacter sp.]